MKKNNIFRILVVILMCAFILTLTGCSSASSYTIGLNEFADETDVWGWIFVWPIGWVMHLIGSIFPEGSGQFAWGLFFTTIIVRTIAWPIYAKSNDMTLKMNVAQPDIDKLNAKYAGHKDPQSQQRQQQEMMAIYKKYKINPLGCLMPFIQMPIFMAMYTVVRRITIPTITKTIEGESVTVAAKLALTDSSFFGLKDCLSQGVFVQNASDSTVQATLWSGNFWVGIILSLLVGGTMFLLNHFSQKQPTYMKKKPSQNQQANQMASTMKIMNYVMIFMMVSVALGNNGLALYWIVGNLYSLGQTIINRKINEKKFYKMRSEIDNLI